jgi:hypothetical protein
VKSSVIQSIYENYGSLYGEGFVVDPKTGFLVSGKGNTPDTLTQFVKDVKNKYPNVDAKKLAADLKTAYSLSTHRKDFSMDIEIPSDALQGVKIEGNMIPVSNLVQIFDNITAIKTREQLKAKASPPFPKKGPEIQEPEAKTAPVHSGKTLKSEIGKSL